MKKINQYKQTKFMTAVEQSLNVLSGLIIAFSISQLFAYYESSIQVFWPAFQWSVGAASNLAITVVLTIVSIMRGYCWRRVFNHLHAKKIRSRKKKEQDEWLRKFVDYAIEQDKEDEQTIKQLYKDYRNNVTRIDKNKEHKNGKK